MRLFLMFAGLIIFNSLRGAHKYFSPPLINTIKVTTLRESNDIGSNSMHQFLIIFLVQLNSMLFISNLNQIKVKYIIKYMRLKALECQRKKSEDNNDKDIKQNSFSL